MEVSGIAMEAHRQVRADVLDASKFVDVIRYMFGGVGTLLHGRLYMSYVEISGHPFTQEVLLSFFCTHRAISAYCMSAKAFMRDRER